MRQQKLGSQRVGCGELQTPRDAATLKGPGRAEATEPRDLTIAAAVLLPCGDTGPRPAGPQRADAMEDQGVLFQTTPL